MRNVIVIIGMLLLNIGVLCAQPTIQNNERWDAKDYLFSNYTYGFGWRLPHNIKWTREQGAEKHTVFRAVGGPFLVFINAQEVPYNDVDFWSVLPTITESANELDMITKQLSGKIVYGRTWEKCILFGQHAIKTTFLEYFKDSRFDEPIETYAEEYMMIYNGYMLIVAIKTNKEVYDNYNYKPFFKQIFQGFSINASCYTN